MTLRSPVLVSARIALALALPIAGLTGPTATPAGASSVPPQTPADVAADMARIAGPLAKVDTSFDCIGAAPQALAYRTDRLVLRTTLGSADAGDLVRRAITDNGGSAEITDVEVIELPEADGGRRRSPVVSVSFRPGAKGVPILRVARHLRARDMPAAPDYLHWPLSGPSGMWPEGVPRPAPRLDTPRAPGIGAGVTVAAYDVGLPLTDEAAHPPNVTRLTPGDVETVDADKDGIADLYYKGHSVAIASTIATVASGVRVEAARITHDDGIATDVSAARRMAATLRAANQAGKWPELIVGAFGSPACDDPAHPGEELVPLGLAAVVEAITEHGQSLFVAAAGNRSTSRKFYPAAFDGVVAVGALDGTADSDGLSWTSPDGAGPRAEFSNHGPWVDAWAPGEDLVVHHLKGVRFEAGGPKLEGIAWASGTSYAAPYTAARIAEQMVAANQSPFQAWAAIRKAGVRCPLSGGVAVTLTSMSGVVPPIAGGLRGC